MAASSSNYKFSANGSNPKLKSLPLYKLMMMSILPTLSKSSQRSWLYVTEIKINLLISTAY